MTVSIRTATPEDIEAMIALDAVSGTDEQRRSEIHAWISAGSAAIAQDGSLVAGYAVLEYSFFRQGFVAMLQVAPSHRRQEVATSLLLHLERTCRTHKLFASTNESNTPMQALLLSLGYEPSGVVYNLDEGDPELFYFKPARSDTTTKQ